MADTKTAPKDTAEKKGATERQKKMASAQQAANSALKNAHIDEWNRLMQAAAQERGVEWAPKPTPEQKAQKQYEDLIKKFPHLAQQQNTAGEAATA